MTTDASYGSVERPSTDRRSNLVLFLQQRWLLSCIWAFAAGTFVTFAAKGVVTLNSRSASPGFHAVYCVTFIQLLSLGPLSLSFLQPEPVGRPPLNAFVSGALSMLSFSCVVVAANFGYGVMLTLQVLGSLSAAIVIDWFTSSAAVDLRRINAAACLFIGAVLLIKGRPHEAAASILKRSTYFDWCWLVLNVMNGAGYALQARCNHQLRTSLGGALRASFVCNAGTVICCSPLLLFIRIPPSISATDWWLWALCTSQQVFHTASMSMLPEVLSYTTTFTLMVSGQLINGVLLDLATFDRAHQDPPSRAQTVTCIAGLCVAVFGAGLSAGKHPGKREHDEQAEEDIEEAEDGAGLSSGVSKRLSSSAAGNHGSRGD